MLMKLTTGDDLPLKLGAKVDPKKDAAETALMMQIYAEATAPAVKWVVNPNTPEGEIDQTIQASDAEGALAAGIIEQFEPGVTEKCPDCGVDRAFFRRGDRPRRCGIRHTVDDGAPEAPKTATGLQMLMEAGMKREEAMYESLFENMRLRYTCGVLGCPACA